MIVDSAALLAVISREPDAATNDRALAVADRCRMSADHHPAKLNLGDRMAYSLAISTGEPLPFKHHDLAMTDVSSALPD